MRHTFGISLVVVVGCVDGPELALPARAPQEASVEAAVLLVDEQEQGRHILGSVPDALLAGGIHFRVSVIPENRPGFRLSVNPAGMKGAGGTHLVANGGTAPSTGYTRTDLWFNDLIMGDAGGRLRIRSSEQMGTTIPSTVYFLDYWSVTPGNPGGQWINYCGPGGGGAIPISGSYDSQRTHHPGPWLSFACADGVAWKCNRWGYIAGNAGPGDPNWRYHQACTGMANANYCGTGDSFTREKTPILIRDEVSGYASDYGPHDLTHPTPMPGHPDMHYIEAGWLPGGRPLCLSKLRWASLSPNQCGAALPDPRFSDAAAAQFCDDWTIAQLFDAGAVLVNGSKVMDTLLRVWRNNSESLDLVTMRGYSAPGEQVAPFTGYSYHHDVEGMALRNLPGSLDKDDMLALHLWKHSTTQKRVIALVAPSTGHEDAGFEVYTFKEATGVAVHELKLCEDPAGHYYNTIGTCPRIVTSLGYVMPPP